MTGDEVAGGLSSVTDLEQAVIENFVGRKPAEQARLNLDKARQTGRVLKYANYFHEQLLELPHRHEEDNVHVFYLVYVPVSIEKLLSRTLEP